MPGMLSLLSRVPNPKALAPAQFAALFNDSDFDGIATDDEMLAFYRAALACLQSAEGKSLERVTAMFKLGELTDMKSSQHFPKLNTRLVLYQFILRVLKPERVNQEQFGICGPAHFTIMLIKAKPLTYVTMAISLLRNGKATADDGSDIVPDQYVIDYDPTGNIPPADWLIAATLRNAQTPIPAGKDIGAYGGTKGPDVFAYCVRAGYQNVIALTCYDYAADWLAHWVSSNMYEQYHPGDIRSLMPKEYGSPFDPAANIRIAAKLREDGWRVLLKVNSDWVAYKEEDHWIRKAESGDRFAINTLQLKRDGLKESMETPQQFLGGMVSAPSANHWVLAKKIAVANDQVSMSAYTWGKQYKPVDVPLSRFVKAYSGFVAARG